MKENDLFYKFFCFAAIVGLMGAFILAIFDAKLQYQEKMLAIQKCPCLEVQK